MSAIALVLYCERDKHLADLLKDAMDRFWPEMPQLFLDVADKSWETPLPKFVRFLIDMGHGGYHSCLRRIFDAPYMTDADTLYVLDPDCFLLGEPGDWGPCSFMASWTGPDHPDRIAVWEDMGIFIPNQYPCLCAGTCSYPRRLLLDNRDLCEEFLRAAIRRNFVRPAYPNPALDNSLLAGLWKLNYPVSTLPRERYTYQRTTREMVLYHAGNGMQRVEDFETGWLEPYRNFLYEGGPREPLEQYRL